MVNMDTVHAVNQDLVQRQSLVAVFAGGSGGIGALSLKALASTVGKLEGKGLRAYIIGRNASSAQEVIAECRELCPAGQYHFIAINDYALIKDVDAACDELAEAESRSAALTDDRARIDYLMLSHGGPLFLPRQGLFHDSTDSWFRLIDTHRHRGRHRWNHVPLLLQPNGFHHETATTSSRISTARRGRFCLRRGHGSKAVPRRLITATAIPLQLLPSTISYRLHAHLLLRRASQEAPGTIAPHSHIPRARGAQRHVQQRQSLVSAVCLYESLAVL